MKERTHRDLESLYEELQDHLATEQWIEAIAIAYRILALEPSYRDVEELLDRAKQGLGAAEERRGAGMAGAPPLAVEVEAPVRRWRWLPWLVALGGAGVVMLGLLVAGYFGLRALGLIEPGLLIPKEQEGTPTVTAQASPEVGITEEPTSPPKVETYVGDRGHFSIRYPAEWAVSESDAPLNAIVFTEPWEENVTVFMVVFGPGGGESAEQVWHDVLTIMQLAFREERSNWWISEAESTQADGEHARKVRFTYTQIEDQLLRRGYAIGFVHGGINYALIGEAAREDWEEKSPLLESMIESFRFS